MPTSTKRTSKAPAKNAGSVIEDAKASSTVAADATTVAQPAPVAPAAAPKKVLPAVPEGWLPGESRTGFVRYARRLKANGQPVSEYRIAGAVIGDEKAIADSFRAAGVDSPYVLHNHTTGQTQGFDNHADAYAASMASVGDLARSVVVSIGGEKGLTRLSTLLNADVRQRIQAIIADDEKEESEA